MIATGSNAHEINVNDIEIPNLASDNGNDATIEMVQMASSAVQQITNSTSSRKTRKKDINIAHNEKAVANEKASKRICRGHRPKHFQDYETDF